MTREEKLARFEALRLRHNAELGVNWSINESFGPYTLMSLYRRGKKGNGRIAMTDIVALADELGVTLTLGTSVEKLFTYYESFGFVTTEIWDHRPHYYGMKMERKPLKLEEAA